MRDMARKRTLLFIGKLIGLAGVLCVSTGLAFLCISPAFAHTEKAGLVSEVTLRDVILGREDVSDAEMQMLDVNGDGQLDVADLIAFLKASGETPKASFELSVSETTEGDGIALAVVQFSRAFTGTLNYSVNGSSSATAGADYTTPTGQVTVQGTSVGIPIPVLDDLEMEGVETIVLHLEEGTGYELGAPSEHTLYIDENDVAWQGIMIRDYASRGFTLEIRRDGATTEGVLRGDDTGIIPIPDPPDAGWPVQSIEITESTFSAHIESIPVPETYTARLATTFTRSIDLVAVTSEDQPTLLDTETHTTGEFTETLTPDSPAFQHLARTVTGAFIMSRAPALSNVPEAPLMESK